jgi:hypothetical protein
MFATPLKVTTLLLALPLLGALYVSDVKVATGKPQGSATASVAQQELKPDADPDLKKFVSAQEDNFTIGIPASWVKLTYDDEDGRHYLFRESGTTLSLHIRINAPNSLAPVLKKIATNQLASDYLPELEKRMRKASPEILGMVLTISKIDNLPGLSRTYMYQHVSGEQASYLKARDYQFIYKDKQYTISYSAGASTAKEAARSFVTAHPLFEAMIDSLRLM